MPDDMSLYLPEESGWEESFRAFIAMEKGEGVSEESLAVFSGLINQSPSGLIVIDAQGSLLLINDAAAKLFHHDRRENARANWDEVRRVRILCDYDETPLLPHMDPLSIALREKRRNTAGILVKSRDAEDEDWVSVTAFPVLSNDSRIIACVAFIFDVTDYKGMQDALYHQATHDPLTGLSNRALLFASLAKAFARAKRGHLGGAIFVLDIDKFKRVNDSLGHAAGDELLVKVAQRMVSEVRETDVVARIGGDEFAILLADFQHEKDLHVVGEIADRICRSVSNEFTIWGNEVYITVSIGISLFPRDGLDEETLIMKADEAMYRVKERGRNGWCFWEEPQGE